MERSRPKEIVKIIDIINDAYSTIDDCMEILQIKSDELWGFQQKLENKDVEEEVTTGIDKILSLWNSTSEAVYKYIYEHGERSVSELINALPDHPAYAISIYFYRLLEAKYLEWGPDGPLRARIGRSIVVDLQDN